jgi:competence transcription factor ComK
VAKRTLDLLLPQTVQTVYLFPPHIIKEKQFCYWIGISHHKYLKKSDWENAEVNLKNELNKQFKPIEIIGQTLQTSAWN